MLKKSSIAGRPSDSFFFLKPFIISTLFLLINAFSAEQKIITIPSLVMKKDLQATIVLPRFYAQSLKHYSVIYLLHGYGGDHTVWPRIVPLARYADSLDLIFICPDGDNSWYLDSPVKKGSRFETYIINEIVPFIDSAYRTWNRTEGRALMGTSMGGHGAFTLCAKHPEIFAGACAIAGIMDLAEFHAEWDLAGILGPYIQNKQRWNSCSGISQIGCLKNLRKIIILDCGTRDFALKGNLQAHKMLQRAGIRHFYYSRPGMHDFHYASSVAAGHIIFLSQMLLHAE